MKKIILYVILPASFSLGQPNEIKTVDSLLNKWHYSASVADEITYFSLMNDECIFLGTDKNERWTKNEFIDWSQQYFNRESAWVMKPLRRNIFLTDDNSLAWFDEVLEAGIGECRGSGVLIKTKNGWEIIQYNLALTIPNDIAADVKKLVDDYYKSKSSERN